MIRSHLQGLHGDLHVAVAREHDHPGRRALLLDRLQHLEPTSIRKPQVKQDHVRRLRPKGGEPRFPIARLRHLVPLEHEVPSDVLAERYLVVDDQQTHGP